MANKEEYIRIRDAFHEKRDGLNEEIKKVKSDAHKKISDLGSKIHNSRPVLESAVETPHFICPNCDIYSMKFDSDKKQPYFCMICGFTTSYY